MRRIFWRFSRIWFLIDPLHYLSSCSDFGLEFVEIFIIKKQLPDSSSRRLSDSASWGGDDSPNHRVGESAFECLKENSASRQLPDSPSRGVAVKSRGVAFQIFLNLSSL
jgi:hypothetical protein